MDSAVPDAGNTPQPPLHGLRSDWVDDYSAFVAARDDAVPGVEHDAATAPTKGVRGTLYSVRWSGKLATAVAGEHTFFASADDGVRIFVDDKPVVDDWRAKREGVTEAGEHDTAKGRYGLVAPITWTGGWPVLAGGTSVTEPQLWP